MRGIFFHQPERLESSGPLISERSVERSFSRALCRRLFLRGAIRSVPASSIAWRGRVAMQPALCSSTTPSAEKWLELLKEIAPSVTRAAVLRDPTTPTGIGQFTAIQAVALSLKVEVISLEMRDAPEIERAVAGFARSRDHGIVTGASLAQRHHNLIIALR